MKFIIEWKPGSEIFICDKEKPKRDMKTIEIGLVVFVLVLIAASGVIGWQLHREERREREEFRKRFDKRNRI